MSENQIALKTLSQWKLLPMKKVMALIKRGIEFKNGAKQRTKTKHHLKPFLWTFNSYPQSLWVAELRILGYDLLDFDVKTSSVNKGETLYDTIWSMSALGVDVCVIRHPEVDYYKRIGWKPNDHCIYRQWWGRLQVQHQASFRDLTDHLPEFGHFDGLKVCIAGDLDHSRVSKSNIPNLETFGEQPLYFAGPDRMEKCGIWRLWNLRHYRWGHWRSRCDDVLACVKTSNHSSLKKTTTVFMALKLQER